MSRIPAITAEFEKTATPKIDKPIPHLPVIPDTTYSGTVNADVLKMIEQVGSMYERLAIINDNKK